MTCSKGFPDPNNKSGEVGGIFDLPPSDERKLRSPGTDKLFWILVGLPVGFWTDIWFSLDFCWIFSDGFGLNRIKNWDEFSNFHSYFENFIKNGYNELEKSEEKNVF